MQSVPPVHTCSHLFTLGLRLHPPRVCPPGLSGAQTCKIEYKFPCFKKHTKKHIIFTHARQINAGSKRNIVSNWHHKLTRWQLKRNKNGMGKGSKGRPQRGAQSAQCDLLWVAHVLLLVPHLQNSSFWMNNSSFSIHNSSCLMHNSSCWIPKFIVFTHAAMSDWLVRAVQPFPKNYSKCGPKLVQN